MTKRNQKITAVQIEQIIDAYLEGDKTLVSIAAGVHVNGKPGSLRMEDVIGDTAREKIVSILKDVKKEGYTDPMLILRKTDKRAKNLKEYQKMVDKEKIIHVYLDEPIWDWHKEEAARDN